MDGYIDGKFWILRADGRVELSTSDGSAPTGSAQAALQVLSASDGRLELPDGFAWRLAQLDQPGASPRVLVLQLPRSRPQVTLTPRQREVSEYAIAGATATEIARHLGVSFHTVRTHLRAAYRELGVSNRIELLRVLTAHE